MAGAFLWDDKIAGSVSLSALAGTVVPSMPLSNLLDPQPRLRARLLGSAASILVDLGADAALEAVALISTSLTNTATIRWRAGPTSAVGIFDSGTLSVSAVDNVNGNVVLVSPASVTARYCQFDVTTSSASFIDLGRLIAGPLWRPAHAHAYGIAEGRLVLDRRDRNSLTGAEFPVPAVANPRMAKFTLPLLTSTETLGQHRSMLATLGAAGDALWIPDTSLSQAELNQRSLYGAVAGAGDETFTTRDSPAASSRTFRIIERL